MALFAAWNRIIVQRPELSVIGYAAALNCSVECPGLQLERRIHIEKSEFAVRSVQVKRWWTQSHGDPQQAQDDIIINLLIVHGFDDRFGARLIALGSRALVGAHKLEDLLLRWKVALESPAVLAAQCRFKGTDPLALILGAKLVHRFKKNGKRAFARRELLLDGFILHAPHTPRAIGE
jgi:hypothetical protein